jgi:uncharacterized membrane protein
VKPTPRIDFLTDGVFAIVATLLVLDIHVPVIPAEHSASELRHSLREAAPSFVAFAFSFLTILAFWLNHDGVGRVITRYPYRLVWLNLMLLLWISLIPFATKFISEYPGEPVAVLTYGIVMVLCASTAVLAYAYVAYWSDVMQPAIDVPARRRLLQRFAAGPALYLIACLAAFIDVRISIAIYIGIPLLFFVPTLQEGVLADLRAEDESATAH